MEELKLDLKKLIIDSLELEDVNVNDIEDDAPLFVEGLGLDSIDALELGLAVKKKYNVKLDANSQQTRNYFASVNNLAAFISSSQ